MGTNMRINHLYIENMCRKQFFQCQFCKRRTSLGKQSHITHVKQKRYECFLFISSKVGLMNYLKRHGKRFKALILLSKVQVL